MIAASMIFSIRCCSSLFVSACRHNFIVLQPFMAKAALQQSFFGCSQLQQQPFCVCRHSYIVLQPSIPKAAAIVGCSSSHLCLQQQPLWVYKHIYIVLQPFMAQAAVIVGCSSSFKWHQEYIMAAESEVAVRRGSYRNTRSHYCAAKWQK